MYRLVLTDSQRADITAHLAGPRGAPLQRGFPALADVERWLSDAAGELARMGVVEVVLLQDGRMLGTRRLASPAPVPAPPQPQYPSLFGLGTPVSPAAPGPAPGYGQTPNPAGPPFARGGIPPLPPNPLTALRGPNANEFRGLILESEDKSARVGADELAAITDVVALIEQSKGLFNAERTAALVEFSDRLIQRLHSGMLPARMALTATERQMVNLLVGQVRLRSTMDSRIRTECRTCGRVALKNPDFDKMQERNKRRAQVARGIGAVMSTIAFANMVAGMQQEQSDFVCPQCKGLDAEFSVVVFCPQCKAQHGEPVLKSCKCGHQFRPESRLRGFWRSASDPSETGVDRRLVLTARAPHPVTSACFAGPATMLLAGPSGITCLDLSDDGATQRWSVGGSLGGGERVQVAASPSGGRIITARISRTPLAGGSGVSSLSPSTGQMEPLIPTGTIGSLSLSRDGDRLALATNALEIWDLDSRRKELNLEGGLVGRLAVLDVVISPDGSKVAGRSVGSVQVWRVNDGEKLAKVSVPLQFDHLAWTSNGRGLAFTEGGGLRIITYPGGTTTFRGDLGAPVTCFALTDDGALAIVGGRDGTVRFVDLALKTVVDQVSFGDTPVSIVCRGDRVAVAGASGQLQLWHLGGSSPTVTPNTQPVTDKDQQR